MSTSSGSEAEDMAADYLKANGFKILARNSMNRWAEIDIIAGKDGTVHFVEVKYRRRDDHGSGFDYITPDKQRRLRRAAEMWMAEHNGQDCQIDVIAISGLAKPQNLEYLPNAVGY